jgi:hypothetical protein
VVAGSPAPGVEQNFDGVYSGKRVLTKGAADSTCPSEDDVSVTIHGGTLTFTNSALQNFPQSFDPSPEGQFGDVSNPPGLSARQLPSHGAVGRGDWPSPHSPSDDGISESDGYTKPMAGGG